MKETQNYVAKVALLISDPNSGKEKKVKESYLVEGVNVTDVETTMYKEFEGDSTFLEVVSVTASPIIKFISK